MCRFRLTSIITDLFLRTGVVRAREITLLEAVETERYQVRTVIAILHSYTGTCSLFSMFWLLFILNGKEYGYAGTVNVQRSLFFFWYGHSGEMFLWFHR